MSSYQYEIVSSTDAVNFTALDKIPEQLRERLLKLINSGYDHFIITGSDPRNIKGCCPSDQVAAANLLVEAGILHAVRFNSKTSSCPVNIYAFSGEIRAGEKRPEFKIDPEFRTKITDSFNRRRQTKPKILIKLTRWSLLLFVGVSLFMMFAGNFTRQKTGSSGFSDINLVEDLDLPFRNGVLILQFFRSERCEFCTNMEKFTRATLNIHFTDDLKNKSITFRPVNMDLPKYKTLKKKYDIFTSTLVFIQISDGHELKWQIVSDAWNLTNNREKFIQMLRSQLKEFRDSVN